MVDAVTMSHPDLPGREIEVHPRAVPVHEASGWTTQKNAGGGKKAAPKDKPPAGSKTATSGTDAAEAAEKED